MVMLMLCIRYYYAQIVSQTAAIKQMSQVLVSDAYLYNDFKTSLVHQLIGFQVQIRNPELWQGLAKRKN